MCGAGPRKTLRRVASERSERATRTGPPTPRLRRGLAVALRAEAEARRRSGARESVLGSSRGDAPRENRKGMTMSLRAITFAAATLFVPAADTPAARELAPTERTVYVTVTDNK